MSHSTAEGNAAESFSADSETQPVKDEDAKPNSRLSWLRTQFLGGLTAGVVLTLLLGLLGMSINTYFSIASQRHEKKQALDSVLNRLSDLITGRTDDSLSIVVRAIAQSRSSGSAETDSTVTTPDTTESSSKVVGKGRAAGDAAMHGHSTDGSSQTATTDRPDQERDLLPGLPERSATESLDVAHLYEQARSLEQEVRILQVELPYVNYILLARAAALVGRYDQAEAYLDDAEEAAIESPHEQSIVFAARGHLYYEHSSNSAHRDDAARQYLAAIRSLDSQTGRFSIRGQADLYAQWTLDALKARDEVHGIKAAEQAMDLYRRTPWSGTRLSRFLKRLERQADHLAGEADQAMKRGLMHTRDKRARSALEIYRLVDASRAAQYLSKLDEQDRQINEGKNSQSPRADDPGSAKGRKRGRLRAVIEGNSPRDERPSEEVPKPPPADAPGSARGKQRGQVEAPIRRNSETDEAKEQSEEPPPPPNRKPRSPNSE